MIKSSAMRTTQPRRARRATPLIEGTKNFIAKFHRCKHSPRLGPLYQRGGRRLAGRGVLLELAKYPGQTLSEGWPAPRRTGCVARTGIDFKLVCQNYSVAQNA